MRAFTSQRGGALGKLIVLLVVVGAFTTLAWMLLLPTGVRKILQDRSGFVTQVDRFALNPVSGRFSGGGVQIENPPQWGGGRFVEVADFSGRVDALSATREELVIEELVVNLAHLVIVISPDGQTNAQAFGAGFAQVEATPTVPARRVAVAGLPMMGGGPKSVLVRKLHLKIGRVEVLQPGHPTIPHLSEQLDFEGDYVDVRDGTQLLSADLIKRLARSPALWRALLASQAISSDGTGDSKLQQLLQQAGGALNSLFRKLE